VKGLAALFVARPCLADELWLLSPEFDAFAATERSYNDKGRLATVERRTDGRIRRTRYRYADSGPAAGTLRAVTDALGRTTTYTRDANGRIIEQTGPGGRSIGFGYDAEGRLTRVDPPGRPVHIMAYDGNGQRSAYDPPDIGLDEDVTRYRFNAAKQLTAIERPDGTRVSLRYNDGGQRVARTAEVGTWSYTYDADTGTLAGIEAPGGQRLAFERDGPLVTERRWSGSVTGRVTQQHDASFRVTQRTAAGRRIDRSYDADSLVTGAGALSVDRASDHAGVTATTLAAVTTSRSYNGFGELAARSATADGAGLYEVDYGRDAGGRITEETSTLAGEATTLEYRYDDAGRLTRVSADATTIHTYDYGPNGNRLEHTGPSGTTTADYDAQDRLTRYGNTTYSYNAAGDLESKDGPQGTTAYDYDALGNLRGVDLPDGTKIDYVIDGKNRRVGKKVDGQLQKGWLYKDGLNPVAQVNGDGQITHRFVYGAKANVPAYMVKIDPASGDETTYRIVSDHRGSVRLVVNAATGEIAQRMDYTPFGQVTTDTNPGFQPFGFAGGLYDRDTELVRFGARDYDPRTGRWTAKDPIRFAGGSTNLYGYAVNDPVNFVDPNGRFIISGGTATVLGARGLVSGTASALATFATGGGAGEVAKSFGAGFVAGAIPGGLVTSAAVSGGANAASQAFNPCSEFNFGSVAGSAFGGALSSRFGGGKTAAQVFRNARGTLPASAIPSAAGTVAGRVEGTGPVTAGPGGRGGTL